MIVEIILAIYLLYLFLNASDDMKNPSTSAATVKSDGKWGKPSLAESGIFMGDESGQRSLNTTRQTADMYDDVILVSGGSSVSDADERSSDKPGR